MSRSFTALASIFFVLALGLPSPSFSQERQHPSSQTGLEALSSSELAAVLLPAEQAVTISLHRFTKPHPASPPAGDFQDLILFSHPASLEGGGCVVIEYRISAFGLYYAIAKNNPFQPIQGRDIVGLADDCGALEPSNMAHLNPGVSADEGVSILQWLGQVRDLARLNDLPLSYVTCRSEVSGAACSSGPQGVLAKLPLEKSYIIEKSDDESEWIVSVMPEGPGNAFYEVTNARSNAAPVIQMVWGFPPPF